MLMIAVPGERELRLEHLVLDANGTLTDRGALTDGVADAPRPDAGARPPADTFGTAERVAVEHRARRRTERLQPSDHELPRLKRQLVCGW